MTEGNTGTTPATFTVTLSAASTQTVTVNYATGGGTAAAGTDYGSASGTVTFYAGETTKTVLVPVYGDTVTEPDETFLVTLSGAVGATIADSQGVATVTNDDTAAVPSLPVWRPCSAGPGTTSCGAGPGRTSWSAGRPPTTPTSRGWRR